MSIRPLLLTALISANLAGCAAVADPARDQASSYYGTLHPFAKQAVYFLLTDRFVDGDPSNNHAASSGFDLPLQLKDDSPANVGYLGGDFKGVVNNAKYIADMGFGAVWLTPIVDNPAAAFTGGDEIKLNGFGMDRGKAAYHGYWGSNFYQLDEHLPSADLDYRGLTAALQANGLQTILDVVINHGSPAYSMAQPQPEYGKLYDGAGQLLADHQNLPPAQLNPRANPLHAMFATQPDLAQLADFDFANPAVMDYFVGAYLQWIDQGATAFRLDTVKHAPNFAWAQFSQRIRAQHPNFFMFGEVYSFDAAEIGQYTFADNGGMSVLDFPQKQALGQIFEQGQGFETLASTLYLDPHSGEQPYANPYELTTFYDNHDMARINTSDAGFIDAHNWLFTARGIPVIYYGSEIGFERGKGEHFGNRNYFGQARIEQAKSHPIQQALSAIAKVRQANIALQQGLQLTLELQGDRAAFMRVFQHDGVAQQALVLLNKGEQPQRFTQQLQAGPWREALTGQHSNGTLSTTVAAHGVQVWLLDEAVTEPKLAQQLQQRMMR
ncbi:alpha-amylase family glycosyl hydrolase [uncultured Ferrimonas sp.]|uniref:alpha-amylase family glycosyl hydrolase n=1 Tax=uncultured Ferrimonas sp. TaxID=432640 RepID=UPI00261B3186|nr:alpha-amylase family glycosyl hydrolase [uncultured Ferrimonas sp.]